MTVNWVNRNVYVKVRFKVMLLRLFHDEVQGLQWKEFSFLFFFFFFFKWEYAFVETLDCQPP